MNKKNKIILGSSAVAGLTLVGGVLAFFHDEVETAVTSKVGTVSVTADITKTDKEVTDSAKEIINTEDSNTFYGAEDNVSPGEMGKAQEGVKDLFEDAPDNLNPGDNDGDISWDEEEPTRPGTDHEINISVNNTGSKSVKTRVVVTLTGTTADGDPLTAKELKNFTVNFDLANTFSGVSALHHEVEALCPLTEKEVDGYTISYTLDESLLKRISNYLNTEDTPYSEPFDDIIYSNFILSGNKDESNAEIEKFATYDEKGKVITKECPSSGSYKLDICMNADAKDTRLQGANLTFKVTVEAMQHRNTSNGYWNIISSEDFSTELG